MINKKTISPIRFSLCLFFFLSSLISCVSQKTPEAKSVALSTHDSARPNSVRPNIVLIVADDQGYADIGAANLADDVVTPNIDKLASQGTRFTQAYSSSPICNASRVGLITGSYQQRQGTYWYGGPGLHRKDIPTLAQLLKTAGYSTGYVGKFHYGKTIHGNSIRRDFPLNHGFDSFYGFEGGRKHYLNHTNEKETAFLTSMSTHQRTGQSLEQGPMWVNSDLVDQEGFSTELFSQKAEEYITQHQNEPFFLQLSFNAVHNFTHQLPKDYLKSKKLKGYRDWDPATEDYRSWYEGSRYPNNPEGRAHYLGHLHYLDTELGKVINTLEKTGLRQNTIVIYISDNGGSTPIYANNYPLRGSKYTLYEGGIRIPMIISWPGKYNSNRVSDAIVSAMDILPTLCDEVTGCHNKRSDGVSLSSLLRNSSEQLPREALIWDTQHETAVRKGKWKLKTAAPSSQEHAQYEMVDIDVGEFLYDLNADPGEKINLAKTYPDIVTQLSTIYKAWDKKIKRDQKK